MQWLNPAGIGGLVSLAVITVLYLLRRKSRDVQVPSLLLFVLSENQQLSARPFQKLKKNLLYILQMLLALLLVFALLRPALPGGIRGETVLVFDLSASMQAEANGTSRLDIAKRKALTLLDGMRTGDRVTVLTAGTQVGTPLNRSTDHSKAARMIGALTAGNGGADVASAVSLAQAMAQDAAGLNIVVFSDTYEDDTVQIVRTGQPMENRAVLSLSAAEGKAFARVANYGEAAEITVALYADDVLFDMAGMALNADETRAVRLNAPEAFEVLRAEILETDALTRDNERWLTPKSADSYHAVLAGDNIFLEKAVALREDLVLLRTTVSDVSALEGIDLYIFDGELPEVLPAVGAVLAIRPEGALDGIQGGEVRSQAARLRAAYSEQAEKLCENLLLEEIAIKEYTPLTGGEAVLRWGGDSVLAVAERAGRRSAVLGFDLHDSNLPVKGDFPVLMQNLLAYLLPETRKALEDVQCGDSVLLPQDGRAEEMRIQLPSGTERVLDKQEAFDETEEQGVYTLRILRGGETQAVRFAVHMDPSESDVRVMGAQGGTVVAERSQAADGQEITFWLLLCILALLLVEWGVSRRGA